MAELYKPPALVVRDRLAHYLGPFTSKNAVQLMAKQALSTDPERITLEQIPALIDALGPTLRTLLGKSGADSVIEQIRAELGLRS